MNNVVKNKDGNMEDIEGQGKYIDPSDTLRTTNPEAKFHPINSTEFAIMDACNQISNLLINKNRAYGNSALNPVRIFSKADPIEQLKVRIDDKLSRFLHGGSFSGDNDIDDLIGYLVLLKIANNESWR